MKLIFLDTSNLILLSETKRTNPQRFEEFLAKGKSKESVLALTQTNLVELLKAKHQSTRISHFDFLNCLLPIRYESENFFEKETTLALFRKGHLKIDVNANSNIKFFSNIVGNEEDFALIYDSINIISRVGVFNLLSVAQTYSWKAKSNDVFYKNPKPRFSDMDKSLWGKLVKKIYARFTGIDTNNLKNNNRTMESLLDEFRFKVQIKSVLKNRMDIKMPATIEAVAKSVTVKDCPGLWLRQEAEKNLSRAGSDDYKNAFDLDNIQYLPYIDCLVTDKRIVDVVEQVFRRNNLLESLKSTPLPKKVSNTIESLESVLFQ